MKKCKTILSWLIIAFLFSQCVTAQTTKTQAKYSVDSLLPSSASIRISEVRKAFDKTLTYVEYSTNREIDAKVFGAKGDGVTNNTTALTNAIAYCIANSKVLLLTEGEYIVTNTIHNKTDYTGTENLFIRIVGNVKITVPSGTTAINTALIAYGHNNTSNVNIIGNSLTVNLNRKCKGFLEIRNNGIVSGNYYKITGGEFNISLGSLVINDAYAGNSSNGIAFGIFSIGSFERIHIERTTVDSVSRYDVVNGQCKGIGVESTRGSVLIENCKVSNVLAPEGNLIDADGIAVFGMPQQTSLVNSFREGIAVIINCMLIDNQGRNLKFQVSNATVKSCYFERKKVVGINSGHDVDFQFGNGRLFSNVFHYEKNSGVSPLGGSFIPVIFQNVLSNRDQNSIAQDNVFYTEIPIRSLFYTATADSAANCTVDIRNNSVNSILTLSGLANITRGFNEFTASDVESMTGKMSINMFENSAFFNNVPLLSYNSSTLSNIGDKLSFRLVNNYNLNDAVNPRIFAPISGSYINTVNKYQISGNIGYSANVTSGWTVNFAENKILPNTEIIIDLVVNPVTGGPVLLGSAGYATIKITGQWDGGKPIVELYEEPGGGTNYLYRSSGLGWKRVTLN